MKNYPFFKFTTVKWLAGDISDHIFAEQGLFILIISVYWENNCELLIEDLKQKLSKKKHLLYDEKHLLNLIESKCLKCENGKIKISFLDDQKSEILKLSEKRSNAGRLGGQSIKASAKQKEASAKQKEASACIKNKNKDKDIKENIKRKNIDFLESNISTLELFTEELKKYSDGKYNKADMNYYFESVKNWALSSGNKKTDWIATAANFMLKDIREDKFKKK